MTMNEQESVQRTGGWSLERLRMELDRLVRVRLRRGLTPSETEYYLTLLWREDELLAP
jgi:hypothetical protein